MAFWRQETSYSPIPEILEKESFTLEELLDEEGLIQETKSANGKLLEYLSHEEQISALLSYVVRPASFEESKRAFKYPYVVCEVFCCNSDSIMESLLNNEELLAKLFSALDLPKPLDCVLSGYFARVAHVLYQRCHANRVEGETIDDPLMSYLETHIELLTKMVHHVENTSVAELLEVYLGFHDMVPLEGQDPRHEPEWMAHTPVLDDLLGQLNPSAGSDSQKNAARILSQAARASRPPLARRFASTEFLSKIFNLAFSPDVSVEALNVCIALLRLGPPSANQETSAFAGAVQEVMRHLPDLKSMLEGSSNNSQLLTPYGAVPPLGSLRLKAAELVMVLIMTHDEAVQRGIVENKFMSMLLDLVVHYPFNNLLHNMVLGAFLTVMHNDPGALLQHLVSDCNLASWLALVPEEVEVLQVTNRRRKLRAGYMGHVTLLGDTLCHVAEADALVKEAVQKVPEFGAWVEHTLKGRVQNEDLEQWSFGRPTNNLETGQGAFSVTSVDELDGFPQEDDEEGASAMVALSGGRYSGASAAEDEEEDVFWTEAFQTNDTTAAFRNLQLGGGYHLDSSSSSGSDDEFPVRPGQARASPGSDGVILASGSDEDLDEDTVIVGGPTTSARVAPSDAGFTDFDDFGGFQAGDSASKTPSSIWQSKPAVSTDQQWNAFLDPTDAGWAAFPSNGPTHQDPKSGHGNASDKSWDPFSDRIGVDELQKDSGTKGPSQQLGAEAGSEALDLQNNKIDTSSNDGKASAEFRSASVPEAGAEAPEPPETPSPEFSSFHYWRQPISDSVIEE